MAKIPEKHFSGKPVMPKTQEAEKVNNANMQMWHDPQENFAFKSHPKQGGYTRQPPTNDSGSWQPGPGAGAGGALPFALGDEAFWR